MTEWTPEIEARMEALRADGLSWAAVAGRLTEEGFPTTKNVLLGRTFRKRKDELRTTAVLAMTPKPLPIAKGKRDGCRYIEGDPAGASTVYCDAPLPKPGLPYCAGHMAICYRGKPDAQENLSGAKPKRPVIDTGFVRQPVRVA